MTILNIDFNGYITIDKDDVIVERIDPETGKMIAVDVKDMEAKTLIDGVKNGEFYISLERCMLNALDGETDIDIDDGDDDID